MCCLMFCYLIANKIILINRLNILRRVTRLLNRYVFEFVNFNLFIIHVMFDLTDLVNTLEFMHLDTI